MSGIVGDSIPVEPDRVAFGGSLAESIDIGGETLPFSSDPKAVPLGGFNDSLSGGYDAYVAVLAR